MAYSDFTLPTAIRKFDLIMAPPIDLFAAVVPMAIRPHFAELLADQIPVATAVHTEKARSELIVVPMLMEARRQSGSPGSFFSGVPFDVSPELGLNGICDYLLSRSPSQFILGPPVLAVVEAKNDSIQGGLGQCVAEMVAAQVFNARQSNEPAADLAMPIYGAVTTGSLWRFLRLRGVDIEIDRMEFGIESVGKILAILISCLTKPTSMIPGEA